MFVKYIVFTRTPFVIVVYWGVVRFARERSRVRTWSGGTSYVLFLCFYAVESLKECPAHHLPLPRWCRFQELRLIFKYTQNCELKEIIHEVCEDRQKFRNSKSLKFVHFPFFKGKPKADSSEIELFSSQAVGLLLQVTGV